MVLRQVGFTGGRPSFQEGIEVRPPKLADQWSDLRYMWNGRWERQDLKGAELKTTRKEAWTVCGGIEGPLKVWELRKGEEKVVCWILEKVPSWLSCLRMEILKSWAPSLLGRPPPHPDPRPGLCIPLAGRCGGPHYTAFSMSSRSLSHHETLPYPCPPEEKRPQLEVFSQRGLSWRLCQDSLEKINLGPCFLPYTRKNSKGVKARKCQKWRHKSARRRQHRWIFCCGKWKKPFWKWLERSKRRKAW